MGKSLAADIEYEEIKQSINLHKNNQKYVLV